MQSWGATAADIGLLTNAVQLGFILGTLVVSLSGLADRLAASRIFAVCALSGAVLNASFAVLSHDIVSAAALRFGVGICLAGIYPLGMKLIIGWAPERASSALALLVGMLTLGTALPHALRSIGSAWPWQLPILASSALALLAAAAVLRLGDGPHLRVASSGTTASAGEVLGVWRVPAFRAAAFGYFGHMWELYAFWTLVPMLLARTHLDSAFASISLSSLSSLIIASGTIGCLFGGWLSRRIGSATVAALALTTSGLCCLVFGFSASSIGPSALLGLFILWGTAVVADSPQFSALSAQACPRHLIGSALAIQNAIGFAITIASIAAVTTLLDRFGFSVSWLLLPGPVLGLIGMLPLLKRR